MGFSLPSTAAGSPVRVDSVQAFTLDQQSQGILNLSASSIASVVDAATYLIQTQSVLAQIVLTGQAQIVLIGQNI